MPLAIGLGIGLANVFSSAWTPQKLGGVALWLRADMGLTTVTGAASQWNDQSGKGDANRNAAQAAGAARPTYNATDAAFNSQSTLSFSGSQWMQTGTWIGPPVQPYSIFLVGSDSGANGQAYVDDLTLDHAELLTIFSQYAARAGALLGSPDAPATGARALGVDFNSAASNVYNNAKTARATGDAGAFSPTGLTLGASGDLSSRFLTGKLAEVVVCNTPNATDRGTLFNYFAARYGISIGA